MRWRKTTENPKVWGSSTNPAVLKEDVGKISTKNVQTVDSATENSVLATTSKNLFKTSTHPPDYDYYNNEVEEGEHKS